MIKSDKKSAPVMGALFICIFICILTAKICVFPQFFEVFPQFFEVRFRWIFEQFQIEVTDFYVFRWNYRTNPPEKFQTDFGAGGGTRTLPKSPKSPYFIDFSDRFCVFICIFRWIFRKECRHFPSAFLLTNRRKFDVNPVHRLVIPPTAP